MLIISDDQAWTDYGFMGHDVIQTPNLDRLASESLTFTRGYVPTSLCRPSLATIITGRYAHEHRITGNDPIDPSRFPGAGVGNRQDPAYQELCQQLIAGIDRYPTLPDRLRPLGYVSHQSGKWWEGPYSRGGFDEGMTHGDPQRGGRHGDEGLKIGRQGMDPVLDFIDRNQDQPFFVWYAPFLPHTPHNPPARLLEKYRAPERPEALAKYYAMVEWFDETCGELLEHLEDKGLEDNTIVVYVTDNGWIQRTEQTPLPPDWKQGFAPRSKQMPYEGGVRTPIMIRWPDKIKPRREDHRVVSSIDLVPTLLAAVGANMDHDLPGVDLLSREPNALDSREAIFGEGFAHDVPDLDNPRASLLTRWCIEGRWKLILSAKGRAGRYQAVHDSRTREPELFDLVADPHEEHNLASEHPEVVERLRGRLDEWWKDEG